MRLFIKRILKFTIFLACFLLVLQFFVTVRLFGFGFNKKGFLESSKVNSDLVLLGSSRCWTQLKEDFFDTTFRLTCTNLGVNGHGEITMAIIRLSHYLSTNTLPKFAILTFDPLSSSGSISNNKNSFNKNAFAEYCFMPKVENVDILNYFNFDNYEKYVPLYAAFKYKIINKCFSLKKDIRTKMAVGSELYNEKWDTVANPIKWSHNKYFATSDQIDSITNTLSLLNELCKKSKIKLLCIQTPVYINLYDSAAFTTTKKICNNLKIPFLDANEMQIRNDIKYFHNSNHLNKLGVDRLNNLLKSDTLLTSFLQK